MYAVIQSGGKQYRVSPGDHIKVEKLPAEPGATVDFDQVLLVSQGDKVSVGQPTVPDARVRAEVVSHGLGDKIVVFKYHSKTRYRRKTGHRQAYSELAIKEIVMSQGHLARAQAAPTEPAVNPQTPSESEEGPEYGA